MVRRKDQNLEELLQRAGFSSVPAAADLFAWRQTEATPSTTNLWEVEEWVVRKTATSWTTERLVLQLRRESLAEAFQAAVREEHGQGALVELAQGDRDYWVMLEFIRPRSKHLVPVSITNMSHIFNSPHGAGGFRFHLALERDQLVLQVYDQFALGYVPPRFFFHHTAMLVPLLGLDATGQNNFFEQRYDLFPILKNVLASQCENDSVLKSLWDSCVDRNQKFRNKSTLQTSMDAVGIRLVIDVETLPHVSVRRPNIEVLESRELKDRFADLDSLLLSDQWMDAVEVSRSALATAESPMYLLRRLALLSLSSRTILTHEELETALRIEPRNRLFLSCAIKQAQTQNGEASEDLLTVVSDLGESLYEDVVQADHLKTLEVVLPELLGDCWFVKDPKMAEACYQRVVSKRGNMPRVLTKMAWLTRSQGLRQREIEILTQLLPVERRKSEVANIHLRLAQLYQGMDAEQVVKHALASLAFLPDNLDAVNLVCDTLLQSGRAQEAIQVLTDALERLDGKDDGSKRADLEIAIGEIWESHLGRRDLARERYQRALQLADSERSYRRLAEIFAQLQETKLQADALQGLVGICLAEQRDNTRDIVDELASLYLQELNEPEKAFLLYRKLHPMHPLQAKDLEMILQWPQFATDWEGFYQELLQSPPRMDDVREQLDWHMRLGDLCRYRCGEDGSAAEHYLEALRAGWVDESNFQFMLQYLRTTEQWTLLHESLRLRMAQVSENEQWSLMKLMLEQPDFLGAEEADRFAVTLLVHGQDNGDLLLQRMRTHLSAPHFEAVEELMASLTEEMPQQELLHRHLKAALSEVNGIRGPRKYNTLNFILKLLSTHGLDRRDYLRLAMQYLVEAPAEIAAPALKESLDEGVLPPANSWKEERVLSLLDKDNIYRVRYHMLRAEVSGDPGDAVRQAHSAWRLLQKIPGHEDAKWQLLSQLAAQIPMTDEDWEIMTDLARKRQSFEPLLRGLQDRVMVSRTRDEKEDLLRRVIDIEWRDRRSMTDTLNAYRQLAGIAEDAVGIFLEALQLARAEGQSQDWHPIALELMNHPQALKKSETFAKVLELYLVDRSTHEKVPAWLLQIVDHLLRQHPDSHSVRCAELCRQHEVADIALTLTSLGYYLGLGMDAASQESWLYGIALARNSREMQAYLEQTQHLFRRHHAMPHLENLFTQVIHNGNNLPLAPDLLEDLMLFAACQLFAAEKERPLAFDVLKDFFQRFPSDPRTWSPLFFLHRELSEVSERMAFLRGVLPQLERDAGLSSHFPITVEALRREIETLEAKMKPIPAVATANEEEQNQTSASLINMEAKRSQRVVAEPPTLSRVAGDSGFAATPKTRTNVRATSEGSREEYVDWRLWVRRRHVQKNMTQDLMHWAFENEVEKHVAVQAFAALTGEFAPLRDWQYKVWRDFSEPPYSLEAKLRLPREAANPMLSNDLARLLQFLAPAMVAVFPQVFSDAQLLARFKVTRQRLQSAVQPLPWDHPVLRKAGLTHFAERFIKEKIRLLHLGPMQDDIYFDYSNRDIYLNMDAALTRPLSHLRHRVLKYYRATRLNFYVPLTISMQTQLVPFLKAAHSALQRSGLESLAVTIGLRHDPVATALQKVDRDRARDLFAKVVRQGLGDLGLTLQAMSTQVYRINLAATLDLIGLLEEVFGLDLAAPLSPEATRTLQSSELLQTLLNLCVTMHLD